MADHRARHRNRTWSERSGTRCPVCGRSYEETDRADVHHRDGNDRNGHPENLRKRCKGCHLGGEHDRDDAGGPPAPQGPSRSGPPRPKRVAAGPPR